MADRLTLDTNLLLEYWKEQAKMAVVEELLRLAAAGDVSLAVTRRVREDVPRPPLADRINELPELSIAETASVTRLGYWTLGVDMLGSDEFVASASAIESEMTRKGMIPPDWRDWDHVHAHYLLGRDVFLTWDRKVLEAAPELTRALRVVVMTPEAYLQSRRGGSETM
jgi:hypothetical protein